MVSCAKMNPDLRTKKNANSRLNKTKKRKPEARLTPSERRDLRLLRKVNPKKRKRTIKSITKPKGDLAVSRYKAYQQPDLKKPLPPK